MSSQVYKETRKQKMQKLKEVCLCYGAQPMRGILGCLLPPYLSVMLSYWLSHFCAEKVPSAGDLKVPLSRSCLHPSHFWTQTTSLPKVDHTCLRSQPQTARVNQHLQKPSQQQGSSCHYVISPPTNLQRWTLFTHLVPMGKWRLRAGSSLQSLFSY